MLSGWLVTAPHSATEPRHGCRAPRGTDGKNLRPLLMARSARGARADGTVGNALPFVLQAPLPDSARRDEALTNASCSFTRGRTSALPKNMVRGWARLGGGSARSSVAAHGMPQAGPQFSQRSGGPRQTIRVPAGCRTGWWFFSHRVSLPAREESTQAVTAVTAVQRIQRENRRKQTIAAVTAAAVATLGRRLQRLHQPPAGAKGVEVRGEDVLDGVVEDARVGRVRRLDVP